MASVNFKKLKTPSEVKAIMRHCATDTRLKNDHANKQIDKQLTDQNMTWNGHNYESLVDAYESRIIELDATTNTNKRKDRVTCFSLGIPMPEAIEKMGRAAQQEWTEKTLATVIRKYGRENLIGATLHSDEKHRYNVPGGTQESLNHLHVFVVPEVDGKLNGKLFSNKKNMMDLNNQIEDMTQKDFGVEFMTGKNTKSKKTVEELKNDSAVLEAVEARIGDYKVAVDQQAQIQLEERTRAIEQEYRDRYERDRERLNELYREKVRELKSEYSQKVSQAEEKYRLKYHSYVDDKYKADRKEAMVNRRRLPDVPAYDKMKDDYDKEL